ncbi:hypothetical protein [Streptomyces ardesiacus]
MYGPESIDAETMKHNLSVALLDAVGCMEPIFDAADGLRRDLESRGWSPTVAEQCAGVWLMGAVASAMGGGK